MTDPDKPSQQPSKGRLPTLRPARDLTLGQLVSGPPKRDNSGGARKTFVPNVNYKKQRADAAAAAAAPPKKESKPSGSGSKNRKSKDDKDHQKGGGGRGKQQYVQSYSMFAEGLGGKQEKARSSQGGGGFGRGLGGGGGGANALLKVGGNDSLEPSTQPKKPSVVVAEAKVKQQSFISDLKEGSMRPIGVPFESEVVKKEETDTDIVLGGSAELFMQDSANEGELILLQLPDVLPGSEDSVLAEGTTEPNVNASGDGATKPKLSAAVSPLESAQGGQIGTLQLCDDGSTRLVLNGARFYVDEGATISHLLDVMRFEELYERQGELMTVGHVTRSAVCVPDIDWLLEQRIELEHNSDSEDDIS